MNGPDLTGNDTVGDMVEAFSGQLPSAKTLELQINGAPAFAGFEAAINSLEIVGSTDDDTFGIVETAAGLPNFPGTAPNSHSNLPFMNSGLTPQNVGIQFDGGTGGIDRHNLIVSNTQSVEEIQDLSAAANSGMINVLGQFTMSYENLTPILIVRAGGSLNIDAGLLRNMTEMTLLNLGGDVYEVSGDGRFETTTFSGFDSFSNQPPMQISLQAGVVVNSTGDGGDTNPGDGMCQTALGNTECTLRAAIEEANAGALDMIHFDIPGTGPHTIQPATALPVITDPVVIDGYTEPGASPNTGGLGAGTNAVLQIEVNGVNITDGSSGLTITAGNSTIRGLAINGFAFPDVGAPGSSQGGTDQRGGIVINGAGGNVIDGNFIGTDITGTVAVPNNFYGIFVGSRDNTIGAWCLEPETSSRATWGLASPSVAPKPRAWSCRATSSVRSVPVSWRCPTAVLAW